jgi:hypothetical protein
VRETEKRKERVRETEKLAHGSEKTKDVQTLRDISTLTHNEIRNFLTAKTFRGWMSDPNLPSYRCGHRLREDII